jgi:hypothetical protein
MNKRSLSIAIMLSLLSACPKPTDESDAASGSDAAVDAGTTDPAAMALALGARCSANAPCPNSMVCLDDSYADSSGGHVPKGLCTLDCTTDAAICGRIERGSVCAKFNDTMSYCREGCQWGPQDATALDPGKCHGRSEMACGYTRVATGVTCPNGTCGGTGHCLSNQCYQLPPTCNPICNSDADCSAGTFCDPRSALCTDAQPPANLDSIGEACSTSSSNTCAGWCVALGPHPVCTRDCTKGVDGTCGWSGSGPASAACVLTVGLISDNGGAGAGDYGVCMQLCDCPSDCAAAGLKCARLQAEAAARFGRAGTCVDYSGSAYDFITCDVDAGQVDAAGADARPEDASSSDTGHEDAAGADATSEDA